MRDNSIKDERIRGEIGKYGVQTLLIFVLCLFGDIVYKALILKKSAEAYGSSLIILIVGLSYFSIQLYRKGLIVASTYKGIQTPVSKEKDKKHLKRNLLIDNMIFAAIIIAMDIKFGDEIFSYIYPQNLKVSMVLTIVLELVTVLVVGYGISLLVMKVSNKKGNEVVEK